MSDRSVEDEIFAQARQFSAAMRAAMQRHAQAAYWLERRRARKEISRLVRQERREQQQSRTNHLSWTNQAVDRYRVHAQAVAQRANDPRVDHDRRARDARSLAEHRDRLAAQFIGDEHLTRTEQGIALDGLDAASVFPEYKTGNLFSRAHKVKGLEALHYRARVARETVSARQRAEQERQDRQKGLDTTRRANLEEALLARIDAAQDHRHRYTAEMTWTDPDGGVLTESRPFATEHTATEWLQRNISGTAWADGTTLRVETRDNDNAAKQYTNWGRPETVAEQLADREAVLRERTLSGQVHREAFKRQAAHEAEQERFSATVTYLPEHANQVVHERGTHASEVESARWTAQQLAGIRPAPGTTVHVAAYDCADEWRPERVFRAEGGREMVADEVTQWREGIERVSSEQERDEQQLPATVQQIAAERDQLAEDLAQHGREIEQLSGDLVTAADRNNQLSGQVSERDKKITELTARHQLSIEHNNELTEANARLTRQLTALTAERDTLRGERDEAVQKLAERTPAHERYGSPERQAEQAKASVSAGRSALADYQQGSCLAETVARNGHDREGMDR
ncbi:hypothetical protein IU459_13155 [Nocardia amamiensis]|uniref:Uncharacterized protein n=1 Tax=Nocardia amamiensis TaxID=404578 RepID=A0ABS0CPC0_9NOCA|nr:hypothetical protein [Nocardia amamiensis]MBF6298486.1 hypothetical protein [Nocardia amamiensis]